MKKNKIISFLLIVAFLSSLFSFSSNSVGFYAEAASTNEQIIYNYLKNTMGFNTAAACGVLGNISVESSFSPTAYNSGENAWGICQWEGGRLTNLQNRYPSTWKTLDSQLGFLKWELEGGDYAGKGTVNYLKAVNNTAEGASAAARYFAQNFERCASSTYSVRMNRAQYTYWPKYNDVPDPDLTADARYPVPFKCRIISTTKVQCYNDAAKTSSPGYIYPEDDCVINAIYTNGLLKCDCPWNDGTTKTVYIDKTAFINSSTSPSAMTAPQYAVTYLRSDGETSIGWIDPGDSITIVAESGSYTQIIYPASVGKRCAWVLTSALLTPDIVTYPTPFLCRTISTEKVPCYNDVNFSSSPGYIYPDDDCTITALYSNGKVQCLCPWNDGTTKTVYVNSSVFIPSTPTPVKMTAPKSADTYLRTSDSARIGWIDPGDQIYKLGISGSMTQVIYPKSDGNYRCAWAYTSDLIQTYTVSYNANGGTGAPGNQTKTNDIALTLSTTVPSKTGYSFLGWATNASATSAQYAPGGVYTENASVTLYAVWKANQYNVSYNANGGTGAPSPQTKTHSVALTLSSAKPTRLGYTFLGWATSATATSATYSAGGQYTANSAAILYAVWTPISYSIRYNANGGSGTMQNSSHLYDTGSALNLNQFIRDGYRFLGWSLDAAEGRVMYADGESVLNLSADAGSVIILYALWEQEEADYTPGDINGDGSVNNKDLTRLMKYLAGEDVDVVEEALDVNNDGSINNKDLTRLMKFLAGEDVNIY